MKKTLISLLLLICICLPLFSCNTGDSGDDVTTPAADVSDELFLQLVENGMSEYSICRPSELEAGSGIIAACQALRKAISDKTGATLPLKDDWYRNESEIPECEILVGDVNRTEMTAATMLSSYILKESNFSISISGKKLLIRGGSDSAVCDGVSYLINEIVNKADDSSKSIRFTESDQYSYLHDYRIESLTVAGAPIGKYSIVIPKNYLISDHRTAMYLREYVKQMSGVLLPIKYDDEESSEYEIRIGNTARSEKVTLERHAYSVTVGDNAMQLSADSPYAYEALLDYVTDVMFDPHEKNIIIEKGFSHTDDVVSSLKDGTENTMKKHGEYRIMFNNIYGSCNETLHPRPQRQQQLYELYLQYDPDVIGFQEHHSASTVGRFAIDKLMKSAGYAIALPSGVSGNNYTPVYYKEDKFKATDMGFLRYDDGMNDSSKSVTWVILESLDGGEKFCVASTHFWYKSAAEGGDAGRLKDAAQMKELLTKIGEEHGVPVIVGGDFNCNMSSQPYASIVSGGFVNAISVAKEADKIRSYHSYPTYNTKLQVYDTPIMPNGNYDKSIDHIFIKGEGVTVNVFDAVTDLYALLSTDHCPIYVDVDFE